MQCSHLEGQCSPVTVEDHVEGCWHLELLINIPRVGHSVPVFPAVMVDLQTLEAPAPAAGIAAHYPLVSWLGEGAVLGGHTYHGVRAPEVRGPRDLPHVQAGTVARLLPALASDGVGGLVDRVAVEGERVVCLDVDVGAVVRV